MTDPLDNFDAFTAAIRKRLEAGRVEYGDASFDLPPARLIEEIRQELRDVAGWAYVMDVRLARMAEAVERGRVGHG